MSFTDALLDVVEGAPVDGAVEALADETGAITCLQILHLGPLSDVRIVASARIDPDLVGTLQRHFMRPETNPIIRNLGRCGEGRLRRVQEFVGRDEYYRSAFYADISVPGGAGQCAMMQLKGQGGRYMVPMTIGSGHDWLSNAKAASFENSVRNLTRAMDLRHRLSASGAIACDGGGRAVAIDCMVGEDGVPILAADTVGEAVRTSGPCRIKEGRLAPLSGRDEDRWERALVSALGGNARLSIFSDRNGKFYSVHFSPGPALMRGNTALIGIRHLQPAQWDHSSLEALLGLSPRESDVAIALLKGKSPESIAAELGLKTSSVRIYLRQIYSKTGTDGQRGLMARLNGVVTD